MAINYFFVSSCSLSNDLLLYYFHSTTLTSHGGLLQKVDKTRSPMGYWLWAGVTALTAAAGATLYHYTTVVTS